MVSTGLNRADSRSQCATRRRPGQYQCASSSETRSTDRRGRSPASRHGFYTTADTTSTRPDDDPTATYADFLRHPWANRFPASSRVCPEWIPVRRRNAYTAWTLIRRVTTTGWRQSIGAVGRDGNLGMRRTLGLFSNAATGAGLCAALAGGGSRICGHCGRRLRARPRADRRHRAVRRAALQINTHADRMWPDDRARQSPPFAAVARPSISLRRSRRTPPGTAPYRHRRWRAGSARLAAVPRTTDASSSCSAALRCWRCLTAIDFPLL